MRKIQILGPGCPKCRALAELADNAARSLGIDYEMEKVTDINKIMSFGVMVTPGLVVDGEVVAMGKLPTLEEVKRCLS